MNIRKFEKIVEYKKMRIEKRIKHGDKEIYICEGYCAGDRDLFQPHYKTMYAIAGDAEHITVGEFFTTEIVFPIPDKNARLCTAENRAKEFIRDMEAECPK